MIYHRLFLSALGGVVLCLQAAASLQAAADLQRLRATPAARSAQFGVLRAQKTRPLTVNML